MHRYMRFTIWLPYFYYPGQRSFVYISCFTDWARNKGTRLDFSSGHHPQTNGQIEIVNKELRQVLKVIREDMIKRRNDVH